MNIKNKFCIGISKYFVPLKEKEKFRSPLIKLCNKGRIIPILKISNNVAIAVKKKNKNKPSLGFLISLIAIFIIFIILEINFNNLVKTFLIFLKDNF